MKKISRDQRRHLIAVASENERQQRLRAAERSFPLFVIRMVDVLTPAADKVILALERFSESIKSMGPIVLPPGYDLTWLSPATTRPKIRVVHQGGATSQWLSRDALGELVERLEASVRS